MVRKNNKMEERKLIVMTILLVSMLVGGLIGVGVGYVDDEQMLECSAVGDYDYKG